MEAPRLPLAVPTVPRKADTTKDAFTKNIYLDTSKNSNKYAVKRPGFLVGTGAITTGLNRGVFYDSSLDTSYYIDNTNTPIPINLIGIAGWSSTETYVAGNVVNFNNTNYTSKTTNRGIKPEVGPDWETESLVFSGDFLDNDGFINYYKDVITNPDQIFLRIYRNVDAAFLWTVDTFIATGATITRWYTLNSDTYYYTQKDPRGSYKITRNASNFYLYKNNILVATTPNLGQHYDTQLSGGGVTNVVYGTAVP